MTKRAKPRGRRHHGDLREALLAETLALVDEVGPRAVKLREVARRLGVSEAAPYHHFAGKDHILATLAARGYDALRARMLAEIEGVADPMERLAGIGRAYVAHALAEPATFRVMFGSQMLALAEFEEPRVAGGATRRILEETSAACAVALGHEDATETIARIAWAAVHGVAWLVLEQEVRFEPGEAGAEAFAEGAIAVVIAGLEARFGS